MSATPETMRTVLEQADHRTVWKVGLLPNGPYFHFGFRPGCERANLILSTLARLRTAWWERLSRVAIAAALSPAAANDRSSPSSSGVHGGPGAVIASLSASWRGSDSIRVLLFSLTLRGGRAILRYYPRLLSSWPTSSTDAHRLWSIPEDVESSFPLHLQPHFASVQDSFSRTNR